MRTVVFAYSSFGAMGVRALLRNGYELAKVFTHEDDPQENIWFESVVEVCRKEGVPFATPEKVNAPELIAQVRELKPEIMFSFYYRKMLSPELLGIPPRGALNLHGSLLPKFRGRCPVNWVLIKGEKKTGVTLHYMVEKPDAGDIVGSAEVWIAKEDTAKTLSEKMVAAGDKLLDKLLPLIKTGKAPRTPMDISQGSYFGGRKPEDGKIDWTDSAWNIYNLVRAVTRPFPGAFCEFAGEKMLIWWAAPDESAPGILLSGEMEIDEDRLLVGAKFGALRLEEIEWRGKLLQGPAIAEALEPYSSEKFK